MLGSIYLSTCCGVQGHSIVDFSFVAAFRATLRTNTKATSKIKKKLAAPNIGEIILQIFYIARPVFSGLFIDIFYVTRMIIGSEDQL